MKFLVTLGIGLLLLGGTMARAGAHPGRLDPDGCHRVTTRWVGRDGIVFEPGTRHCHHPLGQMWLGTHSDVLQDEHGHPQHGPPPDVVVPRRP